MSVIDIAGELVGRAGRTKHHKLDSHSSAEKPAIQCKHKHQQQAEHQDQHELPEIHAMTALLRRANPRSCV
jgi:hypothetical protein